MSDDMTIEQPEAPAVERPAYLPEKFWDGASSAVRTDALAKSYTELERRMGGMVRIPGEGAAPDEVAAFRRAVGVPDDPAGYQLTTKSEMLESDAEVNRLLHEAGFSQTQAQLVYDLAADKVLPIIEQIRGEFDAERQIARLAEHFGGEAKWSETSRQLGAWGRSHLPSDVFDALTTTYEGVVALHRMMTSGEPSLIAGGGGAQAASETDLKRMMRDPRYWRDRDPAFVEQVAAGFRRLYPGE